MSDDDEVKAGDKIGQAGEGERPHVQFEVHSISIDTSERPERSTT